MGSKWRDIGSSTEKKRENKISAVRLRIEKVSPVFITYTHKDHPPFLMCVFINDMLLTSSAGSCLFVYGLLCSVHTVGLAEMGCVVFSDDEMQRSGVGSGIELTELRHQVSSTRANAF